MQILGLMGMHFDAVVIEVKTFLLLFRLALAILCSTTWHIFGHICKIEATEKYKIVNLRPPNVCAEKLSFAYVLKLEISVKRIALCQKDSLRRKIRRKIFFLLLSGFFCQSTSLTFDRV